MAVGQKQWWYDIKPTKEVPVLCDTGAYRLSLGALHAADVVARA